MNRLVKYLLGERIFRYLVAGGLTTLANIALYALFTRSLGWESTVSNIAAVTVSVLFAYVINKLFVFRSRVDGFNSLVRECLSFFGARALTIFLDIGGLYVLHTVLGLNDLLVKIALNAVVIVLNYVFSRFLVFNRETRG